MPLTPPYAHVKLNWVSEGIKPYVNDFWFNITGSFPSNWNVANACLAIENHFKTVFCAPMNNEVKFIGTDLLVNNAGIVATSSTYTIVLGTLTNGLTPIEAAVVVRMQSAAAGRTGHGRIFLSGVDNSLIDGGRVGFPIDASLAAIATAMQTSVTDQGVTYHPGVYSRKDNLIYNAVFCSVEVPLGTQRNRRTRR
jgi:hypothetical protein